jgi:AGZA family xanthine/uracil permease-like MFS transporter
VPLPLKRAIGIGLFLALIGFKNAGFVSAGGLLTLGDAGRLHGFPVALFAATLLFTAWLVARGVRGALLIGMAASALGG